MILVIGGTSDSLIICDKFKSIGKDFILSVTTEYGRDLALEHAENISLGKMDFNDMKKFVSVNNIDKIIDATHPYAVEVSKTAIEVSKKLGIGYLRFERKSLIEDIKYKNIYIVETLEEACEIAERFGNNIFIGTGSKNLGVYVSRLKHKNLIARVLPTSDVIKSCEDMGLNADNIIAMKGPFSKDININMYKHYDIDFVITKESGNAGGFLEKIEACEELGIPVAIIKRSRIDYPNVTDDLRKIN